MCKSGNLIDTIMPKWPIARLLLGTEDFKLTFLVYISVIDKVKQAKNTILIHQYI